MRSRLRIILALAAVVILAAVGALVGATIGRTAGVIIGAVLGALAGVVGGNVPGIRESARQRAADKQAADARLRAAGEPPLDATGPSLLLWPAREVVEFTGRDSELAELLAWCQSAPRISVRLVTGAGGVGKTRLALKVAAEWKAAGREYLKVDSHADANAMAAVRGVTSGPVLLVVDYAETRTGLGDLLRAVLDDPGRVRVLLVARSLGEWWDWLAEEPAPAVAHLLREASPIRLDAPITSQLSDAQLATEAVPFFTRELKLTSPSEVVFDVPNDRRLPVLVLHAAALLAVLRSAGASTG